MNVSDHDAPRGVFIRFAVVCALALDELLGVGARLAAEPAAA